MADETTRLQEELERCKADKEFVWTLWKQMQGKSPALTEAISTAVAREKKKNEASLAWYQSQLLEKDAEIETCHQVLEERQALITTYEERMQLMVKETEQIVSIEHNLGQQHVDEVKKLSIQLGNLQSLCVRKDNESKEHLQTVEALLKKSAALEEQAKQEVERKAQLEDNNSRLTGKNFELKSRLENIQCMYAVLEEKLSSANGENQALSRRLKTEAETATELRATVQLREKEIQTLKVKLKGVHSQYESRLGKSGLQEAALREVQMENCQLRSELAAIKEQHSKLESQNSKLKKDKSKMEEKLAELQEKYSALEQKVAEDNKTLDVHLHSRSGTSQEAQVMKELLEKTERELFELKTLMRVKDEEMGQLRTAHEQRLKRMKNLKDSHKLLIQQLKTYEASSPLARRPSSASSGVRHRPRGGLRHENSDDVWNELAISRNKCLELKKDKLLREEEHDLLQSHCLRQQTTIAELRSCLQNERDTLEKKVLYVCELESKVSSTSSLDWDRMAELQQDHLQTKNKNTELHQRCRELERDCHQLRQEALKLQSSMMHQQHQWKSKWLEKLSKSTMTDGLLRTDSATQVESYPMPSTRILLVSETGTQTALLPPTLEENGGRYFGLKADLATRMDADRSVGTTTQLLSPVSRESMSSIPEIETCVMPDSSQALEVRCATFCKPLNQPTTSEHQRREPSRKRYHSESEIFSVHRQMRDAVNEVKTMSNDASFEEIENSSPPSSVTAMLTRQPSMHSQTSSKAVGLHGRKATPSVSSLASRQQAGVRKTCHSSHNCMWKKLLKASQQRLFTLTKQVCALKTVKQSLAQALQKSKDEKEKAVKETRAMAERLQTAKRTIHDLQAEIKFLSSANHDLQSHCSILEGVSMKVLAEQKRHSEYQEEAKRTQTENQNLSRKCFELGDALNSTTSMLDEKTKETAALQEKISHLERDLKNKRQLLADQKKKISSHEKTSLSDKQKMVCLVQQVAELQETLERTRQRVHSLKAQKAQYDEERQKQMERLIAYQHQLEQFTRHLAAVEDDCKRKSRQLVELKKSGEQSEVERKKEQQVALKMLRDKMAGTENQLREYQDVVIELAQVLMHIPVGDSGRKKQSTRSRKSPSKHQSWNANPDVVRRAREIARTTFDLSDAEVDALLSDAPNSSTPRESKHDQEATLVSRIHTIVNSQPPHKERLLAELSPQIHRLVMSA